MPLETCLAHFESPITHIHPLTPPFVGIITAAHDVYLYDTQARYSQKLLHLNIPQESDAVYAFDPHASRLLFGLREGGVLHMVDLRNKQILSRFELDQQSPTALSFSPDGAYFVCGTDQGRVLLWRSDSTTLVARLHSFPEYTSLYTRPKNNFVSALAFEGKRLATSGYGGTIVVTEYQSHTKTRRFHPGAMRINALLFSHGSLIAGNQEGSLVKIDRRGKHPNQRLPLSSGPITRLFGVGKGQYVVAAFEQRHLALIDPETMSIVHGRYLDFDQPITSAGQGLQEDLYIGTLSGQLYHCDLFPQKHLESLVSSGSYAEAYRYCIQEPLLVNSEAYRILESIFQRTMIEASHALESGKSAVAETLLQPFKSAKKKEVAALMGAFSHLKRFSDLFDTRKFPLFYALAEQHPPLQSTALFQRAENLWTERFAKGQKLMLMRKTQEARAAMEPFMGISSKTPLIQLLLHHTDVLKSYSKALHEHDRTQLTRLTQHYPVLRNLPSYALLGEQADAHTGAIIEALNARAFEEARLLLGKLDAIPQYDTEQRRLQTFISLASNLAHAISNNHWRSAYQLLDHHPELMILVWAQDLEAQWDARLNQCETYALRGDAAAIISFLGNLINLPERHQRIGDLLRLAYRVQLKMLLTQGSALFAAGAVNYCDFFGIDTELRQLLKKARRQKMPLDSLKLPPKKRDYWVTIARTLPERIA